MVLICNYYMTITSFYDIRAKQSANTRLYYTLKSRIALKSSGFLCELKQFIRIALLVLKNFNCRCLQALKMRLL